MNTCRTHAHTHTCTYISGFCKKLAPIWEDLATEFKGDINFGIVDGTSQALTKSRFGGEASGFPSVFYVSGGGGDGEERLFYKYGNARNQPSISRFASGGWLPPCAGYDKSKGQGCDQGPGCQGVQRACRSGQLLMHSQLRV